MRLPARSWCCLIEGEVWGARVRGMIFCVCTSRNRVICVAGCHTLLRCALFRWRLPPYGDMQRAQGISCSGATFAFDSLLLSGLLMALSTASSHSTLRSLQLGMGWFPQKAGGCNRVYFNLLQHLPSAGVLADGIVAGNDPLGAHSASVAAFAPNDSPLPFRLLKARNFIRARGTSRYDLACSHFALYTLPMLDSLSETPMVVHFHGPWAAEGSVQGDHEVVRKAKLWVERRVYARADHFIVLSQAFARVLTESYGISPERISVVPGGVDCDRFASKLSKAKACQQLRLPEDRPIVFTVRRLAPRMGLQDLISAAARVRAHVPDVLVLIAGGGPIAAQLQEQIAALGLQDHVRLLGFLPDEDLPTAYRAAALSVVPTVALEGFGLIAAEALAAGVPVLVTPVGGLPEVVSDLSADLVLPATGTDALAEGITAALLGRLKLPEPTHCQDFARRYDWGCIATQTAAIYRKVSR
jgi:glycogen synthase